MTVDPKGSGVYSINNSRAWDVPKLNLDDRLGSNSRIRVRITSKSLMQG